MLIAAMTSKLHGVPWTMIYEQKTPLVIDIAHIKSAGGLSRQGVKVELDVGVPITVIHEQNSF